MRNMIYHPIFHTLNFMLHCARILNNVVVLTTVIEMAEILDGRARKRSVERVRYVINNITLSRCEIWSQFTRSLYFHSSLPRENTDATREIYFTLMRVITLIYIANVD